MKVVVTGASGLVGSQLVPLLTSQGHDVYRLTRVKPREANDIFWDPLRKQLPKSRLDGSNAIIHLAGENIAGRRWNSSVKDSIRSSRIDSTKLLAEAISQLDAPPQVFICASAIGYYGDRGSELLNETSPAGRGFLADVCREWEDACQPARDKGVRVINLRIGVVLSPHGGALAKMTPPFKLGLGGVIGSGNQYWSWITVDDLTRIICHCISNEKVSGPVNATAPCPVTNYDFTKALGSVLQRPTVLPMPAFLARLALGEMADALLLSSARVMPNRLSESGYHFQSPTLETALSHLLLPKTIPESRL